MNNEVNHLKEKIRDIYDFPKQGVVFKDITPILSDPQAVKTALGLFCEHLKGIKVDKVVGMESRGFFFGTLLAQHLNAGFVPVRKPGKLPFETIAQTYDLEYGQDQLEIHSDSIKKGENVLIHDDVLATGGTAEAAVKLVERLGGNIVQLNFLIELSFLQGVQKLKGYEVYSILKY
ncbi:adenine phosphoribosyltransferase [Capnocytophaga canimorsus]|uniref:Adenine phosphoribosyltransferase n=1 Tax=Capnocytophaga canimorsus TaxID=28188 RepID=A0A250GDY9_9FLAO|nr:adenine phosphoribosyltransferase [Capnocytophaga canimorsus]ATA92334.1 adenine phosphoribosyltransferase [Capnocytophaga canimorsus]ATA94457.1 adenine phosphoribosyltransferase [Capnocytophaga canimorsus]VEJ19922.1 Adenine phosphoribosyltransferase [Capnocytophaga canimorsus]GIM58710.1 adenine phosphoribosyltransferase [Capnocytophaga canimorsus]GJQ05647.1 adenine phosphoribosyltransferase [Capnocytophaga canimorsus]